MFLRRKRENDARLREMSAHELRLRRTAVRALEDVPIPHPFDIASFCEALSVKRGRKMVLRELPDDNGLNAPCGLWIAYADEDHIWHVRATSQRHRTQVILHEVGHMLLNHSGGSGLSALLAALPTGISPARVRAVFGRTDYSTDQEHDAELTASILAELVETLPAAPASDLHGMLARVDATMIHPRRDCR
ncbi:secondary metabolite protein [Streptomyces lancefieldiae]|uniref:Secondary metabolite protein n=1 Tax=Streptomyces lancefieldiae TaxID=3075520 RepID=A0ABU3AZ48_9ACTN|nr:secondary metabolite protein [Streptomyces sp. DSM 40712]MDT0615198.1 secondary metabolite protein [Streptomyces sp. DSM 40712]